MDIVNEKTSAYITVSFLDKNGAPAVPTSITYSTRCLSTGAQIKNAINVTPAASIQITLDALDNAIQAAQNPSELKLLTVHAVYGSDDECNDEYRWQVKNLVGI